ncbi:MAG: cyanophycin synthetase [Deltaproteobacteria bacterium]|nr:cyanophycin synthetase [Deltaproteobacteria bacterium]
MKILSESVYVGPNLYALFPVIRLTLDLGPLEQWPSVKLGKAFTDGLLEALPGLQEHGCSYGEPGGFVRRLTEDDGTWLGHILEHVAIELQNVAGADVTFGKTRGTGEEGQYDVVFEYQQREVGLAAGKLALDLLHHLLPPEARPADLKQSDDSPFDFDEERDTFIRFAQRRDLGPSTASLVKAAEDRGIPWLRLNRYSLVQFGHGRYAKRIQATVTSETRNIAVEIASDKEETNKILGDMGLPIPQQRMVYSPREAVRAARRIGHPVVVKPLNANHGRGVSINLSDDDSVAQAFVQAREHSRTVLVESFIEGLDHRLLVINGKLVAASKRVPGHIVGDGRQTVEELMEEVNRDPRRGIGHEKVLTRLELDHQAERLLTQKGYDSSSVPSAGEVVYLRSTGNLSTGGTAVDVTDIIHPDNREMAVRAALAIGLDVAGVDFLTLDIAQSYRETGGAICEVNAAPGFRMHVAPSEGQPRDAAGPVLDMLFPQGAPSRIPIAAVTGTNGKTTTVRMLAHIFKMAGHQVGLATTEGVYIDGHLSVEGDMTGPASSRIVLRDPSVDVAVLETARGGLLKRGMGFSQADVGAVLNVQSDHLGLRGVDTLEDLAAVKRIVIEVAKNTAVLNADDPLCLKMADYSRAEHLCYVTMNPKHALVREHIRSGGRAVVLEEGINGHMITFFDHGAHMPLLWTHLVPATLEGKAIHNVQNAMFAAGVAYSMQVSLEDIRHGLRTFDTSFFQAPGRMNIFDEHPFKVILDYGHNPAAVKAMVDLAGRLEVEGRRLCVLAGPGDRRDEDIEEIARLCAGHFDHYICRRDDSLRGRGPDEVPAMLRKTLLGEGVAEGNVEAIPSEVDAVDAALRLAEPGDLVLIFGDAINRSWKQIIYFSSEEAPAKPQEKSPENLPLPDLPALEVGEIGSLIRDERGVRLARDTED